MTVLSDLTDVFRERGHSPNSADAAARELLTRHRAEVMGPLQSAVTQVLDYLATIDGTKVSGDAYELGMNVVAMLDAPSAPSAVAEAVVAFLHPGLGPVLKDDVQRQQVLEVREVIGDDDLARAWLIGMNPELGDEAPLIVISQGRGAAALAAARTWV